MSRIHDMGGRLGYGPVQPTLDAAVFRLGAGDFIQQINVGHFHSMAGVDVSDQRKQSRLAVCVRFHSANLQPQDCEFELEHDHSKGIKNRHYCDRESGDAAEGESCPVTLSGIRYKAHRLPA